MNSLALFIAARWKILLFAGLIYSVFLGWFAIQARELTRKNEEYQALLRKPASPSELAQRTVHLRAENERLKEDLNSIAELKVTVNRLSNEVALLRDEAGQQWAVRSNRFQAAVELERKELAELQQWFQDRRKEEILHAAVARLAEKAASPGFDPAKERERAGKILQKLADTTREQMKHRNSWEKSSDKSASAFDDYKARLQELRSARFSAMDELGADSALYDSLHLKPEDFEGSKVPMFRSVVPDQEGFSATVYVDGTVEWSRP